MRTSATAQSVAGVVPLLAAEPWNLNFVSPPNLRFVADIPSLAAVRFRRNVSSGTGHYIQRVMAYVVDIDARTARFSLHAGRLQAGG